MVDQIGSILFFLFLGCCALLGFVLLCGLVFLRGKPSLPESREVMTTVEPQAVVVDASHWWVKLEPSGRETFFPPASYASPVYELTLRGVLRSDYSESYADACHASDTNGNFTRGTNWLRVNGRDIDYSNCDFLESDECTHRYVLRTAPAGRLRLALGSSDIREQWHGALLAEVTLLPEGTALDKPRREHEREEQNKMVKAKAKAAAEAKHFADIIRKITVRAEVLRNWGDADFQRRFAEAKGAELLRRQAEIRDATIRFLEQHDLVSYLRRHHPEVVRRFLGEFEALLIAEHLATQTTLPPPPPKPRLSIEEVRERMCRRVEVSGGDKLAVLTTIEDQRSRMLDAVNSLPMAEDARELFLGEIEDWAAGELQRLSEKTKGTHEAIKTIG